MENKQFEGLTNELFLDNGYLIKKSNKTSDYFLDRANEINLYEQLKNNPNKFFLTPLSWEFNKDNNFISKYQYYPEAYTLHDVSICKNKMRMVVNLIDKFHHQDVVIKKFNPKEILDKFKSKTNPIFDLSQWDRQVEEIINNYEDGSQFVLSHNDLVLGNFLKAKSNWILIDFEFASMNHYLFDYASFMGESLPMSKWDKFLSILNLNEAETKKLFDLITYQNYLWSYWAAYMFQETNNEIFKEIALDKLKKLEG
ncbi:phosphotransferase family protein [[Acholeplasma] multilocale]|uniref:phosphotransferase family protein n=1 Tax=[Acholeplasma] multilocale TaxID=264638 RepID=UPI00047C3BF3|nr:phosphotransferase [[Acholeplasma] multilocale]